MFDFNQHENLAILNSLLFNISLGFINLIPSWLHHTVVRLLENIKNHLTITISFSSLNLKKLDVSAKNLKIYIINTIFFFRI